MAKREIIDKKEFLKQIDTINLSEFNCNYILNGLDKAKVTEQEIVKPYLEKLRYKMKERDDDNGGEPLNAVDRGYHLACEHLYQEIDNLLSE